MPIHCATYNLNLLESELFGYEKGAFTGANRAKPGKLELADSGTLFLDDVDDIPFELQVKLVRVLQEFQFERMGGIESKRIDIRVISSTKRELRGMIQKEKFREDLYYRLKVLPIDLPPLRERKGDIPLLIDHFLRKHASSPMTISREAMEMLLTYDWPGNVRELENMIRRMIVTSGTHHLDVHHIPQTLRYRQVKNLMNSQSVSIPFEQLVRETERQLILTALERTDWNKNQAAKILELNRTTLISKMKQLKIPMEKP